jgi:hypothetical protein
MDPAAKVGGETGCRSYGRISSCAAKSLPRGKMLALACLAAVGTTLIATKTARNGQGGPRRALQLRYATAMGVNMGRIGAACAAGCACHINIKGGGCVGVLVRYYAFRLPFEGKPRSLKGLTSIIDRLSPWGEEDEAAQVGSGP